MATELLRRLYIFSYLVESLCFVCLSVTLTIIQFILISYFFFFSPRLLILHTAVQRKG